MTLVRAADDTQLLAAASWHWATALLHLEQRSQCHTFAVAAAQTIESESDDVHDVALLGALQLLAAKGRALASPDEAAELVAAARQSVEIVGGDRAVLGVPFGPSSIGLTAVEIAISRLDYEGAIAAAADIDSVHNAQTDIQVRYFIAIAIAHAGQNDFSAAAFALSQAAERCPDDIRYDRDAHMVLRKIIDNGGRLLMSHVARLVHLAGLA